MKVNITICIPAWLDKIFAWPVIVYRKHKYGYPFRRIYLGDGLWTKVDADVYYRLGHFQWYVSGNEIKFYAARNKIIGPGKTRKVYLHREIKRPRKGRVVDHRNRDPLDNVRTNLRIATHAENVRNRQKTTSKTSSRFRGVSFNKNRQKWSAHIQHNGKSIFLGRFTNENVAAKVYDKAAKKYHGEFASLNFPEEKRNSRKGTKTPSYLKLLLCYFVAKLLAQKT